jgi:hypothetical protein
MNTTQPELTTQWPLWRKLFFRFFFIYLVLQTAVWTWLEIIPGVGYVTGFYYKFITWLVTLANSNLFHVRAVLVPENGSGDTSQGWATLWTYLLISVVGCMVWSVLDRKRKNYTLLNYWLCTVSRYYVALIAFSYGIIKLFCLQMPFPSLHQLATPLGDLLPMRFSWFFIGYSGPYQMFSGAMECMAGLLLMFRRTTTLGVLMATGVFLNVMMLNLCYDIPVKIFSMQMVFVCFFLLVNESKRLINFFVLNEPAPLCELYHFNYSKKWMKVSRIVLKVLFIILTVGMGFYQSYSGYKQNHQPAAKTAIKDGVYEVTGYAVNNIQLPMTDTLRWKDAIFENGTGSTVSADTSFRHRYGRAYFGFKTDSATHKFSLTKPGDGSVLLGEFDYTMPDTSTIQLSGKNRMGDVVINLKRTNRHFQLAERQFHWLSEKNR